MKKTLIFGVKGASATESVKYMEYVAPTGRNIKSTEEFGERNALFAAREILIEETNARTDIHFKISHNQFSDMLPSEKEMMMGKARPGKSSSVKPSKTPPLTDLLGKSTHEIHIPFSVDWRNDGSVNRVSPVQS
jgi:hypothetical protein